MRILGALTEEELRRWLWLRSLEWASWPAFISQPVIPILFIFVWWPYVLAGLLVCSILWIFVRYSYVSPRLSTLGAMFVGRLKWLAAIGASGYLFIHHDYTPAVIALIWPFVAGFVTIPGQVGRVELAFAKKIGYVDQDAEP